MEDLDIAISIVIVLFILSIVTEKFTQLVKNYTSFFNVFLLTLSVAFLIRGFIVLYFIKHHCFLGDTLITIGLAANIFLVSYFRKERNIRNTLLVFSFGLLINIGSIVVDQLTVYFTLGCLILYFSLVSIHLLPEINFKIKGRWFGTKFFKRLENVDSSTVDEPVRDKEITTLSFLTGLCVAYLFNADFFNILHEIRSGKNGSDFSWSWPHNDFPLSYVYPYFNFEQYEFNFAFTLGILLTGFFLSFGSKFFHDLLETLFYAKKAKAALSDPETYKVDGADKIEKWVNEYDLQKFYLKEARNILHKNGFTAVGIGLVHFEGTTVNGLRIYANRDHQNIESLLKVENRRNTNSKVPYQIFVDGGSVMPSAALTIDASLEITNQRYIAKFGAISHPVIVEGEKGHFLLTCYHVVKSANNTWKEYDGKNELVAITNHSELLVGKIFAGARNAFAEAALIKLDKINNLATSFYPGFKISQINARIITKADVGAKVLMYKSSMRRIISGRIVASDIMTIILFDGANTNGYEMCELIEVQNSEGKPLQELGDSGNLLFDEQFRPIGIVFAKNDLTTFVMRLEHALGAFKNLKVSLKI
jgi:hypothetical protein